MGTVLIVLFGIVLPAITLVVELNTGMCANAFFDPIPSLGHILLVAFVPIANLLALIVTKGDLIRWRNALLWLNAVAMGISLFYALVFMPIAPFAVIGIIIYGMGFLPLSPLLAFFCTIALRKRLNRMADANAAETSPEPTSKGRRFSVSLLVGGALGILLLLAMESRVAVTLIAAEMAANDASPDRQLTGVRILRSIGDHDELLRMCYRDGSGGGGLFDRGHSLAMCGYIFDGISRKEAKKVFFRVTGEPFNALLPPRGVRRGMFNEFDFDPDVGGATVAGRLKGLSLADSRIDAKLYPDPAVAYIEWTMVFRNDSYSQREARAQILLPPGGVVSRATLWIDGEPREAAFAGSAQVREAYEKVVSRRRDPLLVTWSGDDRVLVQCFPVPANGEMKIRIGVTAPLVLLKSDLAALRLPSFAERNFSIATKDIHSLWVESDRAFQDVPGRLQSETADGGKHVLRGMLSEKELLSPASMVTAQRSPEAAESWTPDKIDAKKYILQKITSTRASDDTGIVVVIDGSVDVAEYFEPIGKTLAETAKNVNIRALLAGDEVIDVSDAVGVSGGPRGLAARLRDNAGAGGYDNVPALQKALDELGDGNTIVWIHGRQPVDLRSPASLVQQIERGNVTIYDLAVCRGPNRLVEQFGRLGCMKTAPRTGTVGDVLRDLILRLTGQAEVFSFDRERLEGETPKTPESTSHLARLWAAGEVDALARSGKSDQRAEAVKLAAAYQLVTPVSGAVVLENKQQYDESGLKPVDPESVPDLPEPATWILLLTALPLLLWRVWKRRRESPPAIL